jgi:hypothetical protein
MFCISLSQAYGKFTRQQSSMVTQAGPLILNRVSLGLPAACCYLLLCAALLAGFEPSLLTNQQGSAVRPSGS